MIARVAVLFFRIKSVNTGFFFSYLSMRSILL